MTTETLLFANNAKSTLAASISNVATSLTLAPGAGALFPNPTPGSQYFVMTLSDALTNLTREIVHVTARSGDVCTIVRAQEGTSAAAWSAGDLANNRLTAGQMAAMAQIGVGVRTLAVGNLIFYVATTGSDSTGDGTVGTPWATIQHAWDVLQQTWDLAGQYTATINIANGTYAGLVANGPITGWNGANSIVFVGNAGSPTSVIVNNGAGNAFSANFGAQFTVTGCRVTASASGMDSLSPGSQINFNNVDFGACGFAHVFANGGNCQATGNYTISGSAPSHLMAQLCGTLECNGRTVTFSGSPAFSSGFAQCLRTSSIYAGGMTFAGTFAAATGPRFAVSLNSVIETGTAGVNLNYFPGNSAGTAVGATFGTYY